MQHALDPLPSPSDIISTASPDKKKNQTWVRILFAVGLFAVAMGIGYVIGNVAFTPVELGLSGIQKPLFFIGLLLPLPLVLAIHEGGHLLGGKLAGFRFALFIVGPLMISRRKDGIKFSVNKSLGAYGGLAASFPTTTDNLRKGMTMLVAGGPLASLNTGILFLGMSFLFPEISANTASSIWIAYG